MADAIAYVELPAREYGRAVEFYESVFGCAVEDSPAGDYQYGIIYSDHREIGAIVGPDSIRYGDETVSYEPGETAGPLVYFSVDEQLEDHLDAVGANGGSVRVPPTDIGDGLRLAICLDSEGNRIGLLS